MEVNTLLLQRLLKKPCSSAISSRRSIFIKPLQRLSSPSHKRPSKTSKTMSITHAVNTLIHNTVIYDMFSTLEMWTSVMFPLHLKQPIFLPSLLALSKIKNLSDFFNSTFSSKPPLCSLFHSQFSPIRRIHVQQTAMNFFFHVLLFSHQYVATANSPKVYMTERSDHFRKMIELQWDRTRSAGSVMDNIEARKSN